MFTAKLVPGQTYTNRVRLNLQRIGNARGIHTTHLPNFSEAGLWKFMRGGSDITLFKLQTLADDLGVPIFELLANPDERT